MKHSTKNQKYPNKNSNNLNNTQSSSKKYHNFPNKIKDCLKKYHNCKPNSNPTINK